MNLIHLIKVITAYKLTPFAKKLKEVTKPLHDQIESHPFIKKFIDGKLSDLEYAVYLSNLYPIYEKIERRLLCPTSILARAEHIRNDLVNYSNFLDIDLSKYYVNGDWADKLDTDDPYKLTATFYIRWLGDLYGGQILAKNIRFNSSLKFKNVRDCIRVARDLIEYNGSKDINRFLVQVSDAYTSNYDLVTKLNSMKL
ncbi:MAG: hypothetical protein EBU90_03510 [Proteobacteria bacterium]|nr:hypothetical protein [Pseudomonadota bacterium]NBP13393.1 hypothetical protein [bacterium]